MSCTSTGPDRNKDIKFIIHFFDTSVDLIVTDTGFTSSLFFKRNGTLILMERI